jgi:signal peptidase I
MTESSAQASAATGTPQKSWPRDYIETILVCLIFVIFSRTFLFQQSKIPSGSMMDTLLIGDYIMVNRFVYGGEDDGLEYTLMPYSTIKRGDIIVFKHPPQPEVDYIKRVIGLPGEQVALRDGYLFVDGQKVQEPYVPDEYRRRDDLKNFGPVLVKPGHYFVFGDHRNESSDSRRWYPPHLTQVPREMVKGRALLIWWSYEEERGSQNRSAGEQVVSWGDKFIHFFTRTRWSRMFRLIR